jgi:HlyD family secretion protein
MHRTSPDVLPSSQASRRKRLLVRGMFFGVPALLGIVLVWWFASARLSWSSAEEMPMMHAIERADFIHDVTERGNVESASNVEVRCEVQSLRTAGTMILEIVPEGTYVEKGDFLVRLDSSSLENDRTKQQIVCATSKAAQTEAENAYNTALIAKEEYLNGQYKLDEQKILSEILLAEQEDRRSKENLTYSQRLAAKGYITKLQLDAEDFSVRKAANELSSAKLRLEVLEKYTKEKQIRTLESNIRTSEAQQEARKHAHELDKRQLEVIEEQIDKCMIRAPEAGQVVYANSGDRRAGSEVIIEEGTLIREHQVIVRLPDPKRMQVKARINESRISLVRQGMPATIRLDAFPDLELTGTVQEVSDYPAPGMWFRGDVKEYETVIRIDNPPPDLKPGLTAQVKIRVDELDGVLQVPVQAIIEQGARHFCVVRNEGQWQAREVLLGPSNEKFVVLCDVLQIPVPAIFEFDGRPYGLFSSGPKWESSPVQIVSNQGNLADFRTAAGTTGQAQSVFEHRGKPVHLLFDGQQWTVREVARDTRSGRFQPLPNARAEPVHALFDLGGKLYWLGGDSQQWAVLKEDRQAAAREKEQAAAKADDERSRPQAKPGPPKTPPPAEKPKERGPAAPAGGGPSALAAARSWEARQVTLGAVPGDSEEIGVGLAAGDEVVLNALAYRGKIALPDAPSEASSKRRPPSDAEAEHGKPASDPRKSGDAKKRLRQDPAQSFAALDGDGDKKLERKDLPANLQPRFAEIDANKDGTIDLKEWTAAANALRARMAEHGSKAGANP